MRYTAQFPPAFLWTCGVLERCPQTFDLMAETSGGVSKKTVICLRIEEPATFCDRSPSCLEEKNEMSR